MDYIHNSKGLRARRQELRNSSTPQEIKLWQYLRKKRLGHLFYRQHSIGPYIVDFYCPQKRIVIELDGSHHKEPEQNLYDKTRDAYLTGLNHVVLRFWNNEISSNLDEVLLTIHKHLNVNFTP